MNRPARERQATRVVGAIAITLVAVPTAFTDRSFAGSESETTASQWAEYQADVPKTIIELQPFRRTTSVDFQMPGDRGVATLNLNPQVNAWFLLTLRWVAGGRSVSYHLENPQPRAQKLALGADHRYGIRNSVAGRDVDCNLWRDGQTTMLQQAQRSDLGAFLL
jgi:hypothetical protein